MCSEIEACGEDEPIGETKIRLRVAVFNRADKVGLARDEPVPYIRAVLGRLSGAVLHRAEKSVDTASSRALRLIGHNFPNIPQGYECVRKLSPMGGRTSR
jgi:hypothetical protein